MRLSPRLLFLFLLPLSPSFSFLFGGGSGGCGCKSSCPSAPPCPPPPPPRPCQCACPRIPPPTPPPPPCGCGSAPRPSCDSGLCGAATAPSGSYATPASTGYATGGNIARDENVTVFAGSYDRNDSDEKERPEHTELPQLSVPNKYTTYEEFANFLSQANNDDFSTFDKEPGISTSTALRRSNGFRRYREAERRRREERRRKETSRCPNRRLYNMIEEAIWDDGPSAAKYRLLRAARKNLLRPFDIICSEGNFSYFIGNDNFCELRARGVVCLMFEH